jgi:hypothetical protein
VAEYDKTLIRNRSDVPKNVRNVDDILTRVESFWRGHGIKDITHDLGSITGKYTAFAPSGVPNSTPNQERLDVIHHGGIHIPIEGGLSEEETTLLLSGPYHSEPDVVLATAHFSPRIITRRNGTGSAVGPSVWEQYDNARKEAQTRFAKEIPKRPEWSYSSLMNSVRDRLSSDPNYSDYREREKGTMPHMFSTMPHIFSGQFLRVLHRPQPVWPERKDAPQVSFGHDPGGVIAHDTIDLSTGSWARLNKDRTGYDVI